MSCTEYVTECATTEQPYTGFDANALSFRSLEMSGYYTFNVPTGVNGLVVGVTGSPEPGLGIGDIQYGIWFTGNKYKIVESGQFKTDPASYGNDDIWRILRLKRKTFYLRDIDSGATTTTIHGLEIPGELVYVSEQEVSSDGIVMKAALNGPSNEVIVTEHPTVLEDPATIDIEFETTAGGREDALGVWTDLGTFIYSPLVHDGSIIWLFDNFSTASNEVKTLWLGEFFAFSGLGSVVNVDLGTFAIPYYPVLEAPVLWLGYFWHGTNAGRNLVYTSLGTLFAYLKEPINSLVRSFMIFHSQAWMSIDFTKYGLVVLPGLSVVGSAAKASDGVSHPDAHRVRVYGFKPITFIGSASPPAAVTVAPQQPASNMIISVVERGHVLANAPAPSGTVANAPPAAAVQISASVPAESISSLADVQNISVVANQPIANITGLAPVAEVAVSSQIPKEFITAEALSQVISVTGNLSSEVLGSTSGVGRVYVRGLTPIVIDEESSGYLAVMNVETTGISEYQLPWIDVVSYDGKLYGLAADGLYTLTDTATGVSGSVKTGKLKLNGDNSFTLHKVVPYIKSDSEFYITLRYQDDSGVEQTIGPYSSELPVDGTLREWPVKTGRGHRGTWYSVEISCEGQFECYGLELFYTPHMRRQRGAP